MPKETGAKGTGSKSTPTKSSAKGSGAAPEQPELELDTKPAKAAAAKEPPESAKPAAGKSAPAQEAAPVAAAAPAPTPAADAVTIVELVNGVDGVWKKLSNGKRVDLTTKEWRHELSRLFTRAPAP
jgi:hypothetical protein